MGKEQFSEEHVPTVVGIFHSHDVLIPNKPPSLSFLSTFIYDLVVRLENTVCGGSRHFSLVRLLILVLKNILNIRNYRPVFPLLLNSSPVSG